jgi:hypothetical protein
MTWRAVAQAATDAWGSDYGSNQLFGKELAVPRGSSDAGRRPVLGVLELGVTDQLMTDEQIREARTALGTSRRG